MHWEEDEWFCWVLSAITAAQKSLRKSLINRTDEVVAMMLRQAARGLCRRGFAARSLTTSTTARADDEATKTFLEKFDQVTPSTMSPPNFPTDFLKKEDKQSLEAPSTVPEKLTFNFYLPHEQIAKSRKVIPLG